MKKSPLLVYYYFTLGELLGLIHVTHRWHNVPPDPSKLKESTEAAQGLGVAQSDPENSRPLDFETFVPDHDPSLARPSQQQPAYETYGVPPAPGEHISRDEAFNRALGAMYWTGYWTAVYHVSHTSRQFELAVPRLSVSVLT